MAVREGTVPVALGTVVTGVGAVMVAMEMAPMIAAGVVGFGAAHIVLGAIDLVGKKNGNKRTNTN
ncbi:MAG TPA: asparagine synthase [Clostridium sp.]|uniref:asparagine synthase n=1 Tax=Clostridium sp. TaxID=1506 RepID=UPI002F938490